MNGAFKKTQIKYNNKNKEDYSLKFQQKILMILSIILWFISLFTLGFYANQAYHGFIILMFFPVAWLAGIPGLAMYANIFYLWVFIFLSFESKPKISLFLMIILALLTVFFKEVPTAASSAVVYAWGYGAFLWGFSIIFMACAALDRRPFYSFWQIAFPYIIFVFTVLLGLFGLKYWQYSNANIYERERYFSDKQVAFGVFMPSGNHYYNQPFPQGLPKQEVPIELEIYGDFSISQYGEYEDSFHVPILRVGHQVFELPNQFLCHGYKISKAQHFYVIEQADINPIYRYIIDNRNNDKIRLSLYDISQKNEIWYSEADAKNSIDIFKGQMVSLFQQKEYPLPNKKYVDEYYFSSECSISSIPKEINQGDTIYLQIDNKLTLIPRDNKKLFCQNNMVLLMEKSGDVIQATILQRNNLKHLLEFRLALNESEEFKDMDKDIILDLIHSANFKHDGLLLKYNDGEILLPAIQ